MAGLRSSGSDSAAKQPARIGHSSCLAGLAGFALYDLREGLAVRSIALLLAGVLNSLAQNFGRRLLVAN